MASRTEALELIGLGLYIFFNVYDHMMTEWDSVLWLHPSTRARVQMTCNLHLKDDLLSVISGDTGP